MDLRTSGSVKTLPELYDSLFGTSKSAKAFRSLLQMAKKGEWDDAKAQVLWPLAKAALVDLATSQEFKQQWGSSLFSGSVSVVRDPFTWIKVYYPEVYELKAWLLRRISGKGLPRVSAATRKFLTEWVNTNGWRLPRPTPDMVEELRPYRLQSPTVCYRGIQFKNVGELVQFHNTYAAGKHFPFSSERFSSWTTIQGIAERFGKYHSSVSKNDAMFSWFARSKANKDYDGTGGYLIGARVLPDQTLVDLSHPDLEFSGGQHGDEGEVILLPNVKLVSKVYKIFGDVEREVKEHLGAKPRSPTDEYFFSGVTSQVSAEVFQGGPDSGTVTFVHHPWREEEAGKTPKEVARADIEGAFLRQLYSATWLDNFTVKYNRMTPRQRVAARFLCL
jgi:hypothetical protein